MLDHTESQTQTAPKAFTVISGGKSQQPGESHESSVRGIRADGSAADVACTGGLLIRFDESEVFSKLTGIGVVNADIFPPELLLILIKLAMDSKR